MGWTLKEIYEIKNQNINRIRGCNYSIFKEDILQVNGFNEEITTWGREDSEFVQRLYNNGVKKQHLKFSGIQYHLYHDERSHNSINDNVLKDTIMKKALLPVSLVILLMALAYNTFNNKNKTDMKRIINTSNAPKPIGPYNQAVISGDLMFISGQVAFDPNTDELVLDDIQTETKQVMENLKSILEEANLSFKNVVKTTIFLSDMDDFQQVNEVYGSYFSNDQAPARETVEVSRLPKDVNVEISMIACK